ncbi:TadE/TadG family type IV pilus assembly protein [Mangrovibrevibacter kandeliae]|uniref:TadE/TadG family type IV pilus assembly protein n=1 Tax=Mangrovibrevibacter kandeliae TaxID=2968473 RepID=UPI0021190B13|nr:pilus assembly protein [Aurantimonas sp. CSK15Z-1]
MRLPRLVLPWSTRCRAEGRPRGAGFRGDRSGVAAVEFALVIPFLLLLYLGSFELSNGIEARQKVQDTGSTLANLVARIRSPDETQVKNVFTIATAMMRPFDTTELKIAMTAVSIDANGIAKVTWSHTSDNNTGAKAKVGDVYTLPSELNGIKSGYLVFADVKYVYHPTIGWSITAAIPMSDQRIFRPRYRW